MRGHSGLTFEQVKAIVTATLHQAATWGITGEDLHQVADEVASAVPDSGTCPACEEVTCDEGCPFEGTRAD